MNDAEILDMLKSLDDDTLHRYYLYLLDLKNTTIKEQSK